MLLHYKGVTKESTRYPWAELEIGDWFEVISDVPGGNSINLSNQAQVAGHRLNKRFSVSASKGVRGVRITRLAPKPPTIARYDFTSLAVGDTSPAFPEARPVVEVAAKQAAHRLGRKFAVRNSPQGLRVVRVYAGT